VPATEEPAAARSAPAGPAAGPTPVHGYLRYLDAVAQFLRAARDQQQAVSEAADVIAEAIAADRRVRVFGASHAGLLAQDLMYRAGGLAPIDAVLPAPLMLDVRPVTDTSVVERTPGLGRDLFTALDLAPGDVVLLISVSGRNPVVVEAAEVARERGAFVVALTSLTYSRSVAARGPARLFERADLVIDLPGAVGDACVPVGAGDLLAGPTSSAVGAAILHGLCVEVATRLAARGIDPPVYRSANLDGSEQANQRLVERYRGRVNYLG